MSDFYDRGPVGQFATNLFHGCGYNFYRVENQLRADDQRIRGLASGLLLKARGLVEAAESSYRRNHMPPPTRANPFPSAEAVAGAQRLERIAAAIGGVEGRVRHQPVPENDRMTQRYRNEADTLERLAEIDRRMIDTVASLCGMLEPLSADAMIERAGHIERAIAALNDALLERQLLLV